MLKRSLIALAVCVVAAGSAQAQFQERTFRVSNGVSRDHPMGNGLAKMSECTLAKSGGKMKIQSYWDGALGSDLTATQQVRTGSLEMVLTSTAPLVGIVEDLPNPANRVTLDRKGQPQLEHAFATYDLQRGRYLTWDAKSERVTNDEEANRLLAYQYREPWRLA